MVYDEKCSCGASYYYSNSADMESPTDTGEPIALRSWRKRHAQVCKRMKADQEPTPIHDTGISLSVRSGASV